MRRVSSCQAFEWQLFSFTQCRLAEPQRGRLLFSSWEKLEKEISSVACSCGGAHRLAGAPLPCHRGPGRCAAGGAGRVLMYKGGGDSEGFTTQLLGCSSALCLQGVKCLFFLHFLWCLDKSFLGLGYLAMLGTQQAELWKWLLQMWKMFPLSNRSFLKIVHGGAVPWHVLSHSPKAFCPPASPMLASLLLDHTSLVAFTFKRLQFSCFLVNSAV